MDRSSGDSGWLKDLCLERYEDCDVMVNYEAIIIEVNQELARLGHESLYVIYPEDGLAIADSPLGFINQGDEEKETVFLELQAYLHSDEVQQQLLQKGRRTGVVGLDISNADRAIFNPDWGIDVERQIVLITFPMRWYCAGHWFCTKPPSANLRTPFTAWTFRAAWKGRANGSSN